MFEKEAEEYVDTVKCEWESETYWVDCRDEIEQAFQDGAEFGYNKGKAETALLSQHILDLQKDKGNLTDRVRELEQQIEKMKEIILDLLWFEDNLDPYMYECDDAQNGELLKPFTNAREFLKDCICKKCKGEGIVRVGYNGWVKNPCPICKGRGYVIRSN